MIGTVIGITVIAFLAWLSIVITLVEIKDSLEKIGSKEIVKVINTCYCPSCGTVIEDLDDRYCHHCGQTIHHPLETINSVEVTNND